MIGPRYLTALALSPTREKELVDRQKAVLARWGLPSALALPPIMPLLLGAAPPREELFRQLRRAPWKTAPFQKYIVNKDILLAGADFGAPMPPEGEPLRSLAPLQNTEAPETAFLPLPLEGFYIADLRDEEQGGEITPTPTVGIINTLPELPGGLIRTLRLLVLEVFFSPQPWWQGVRWVIQQEEWIKTLP